MSNEILEDDFDASEDDELSVANDDTGSINFASAGSKNSGSKKKPKKGKKSGKRIREICDVFGEAAMTNAYNISHSVQDMLSYRGFGWTEKKK